MTDAEHRVLAREADLRAAVLARDVDALDRLLDDAVRFTDPDGTSIGKAEDLELHRSGRQGVERMDVVRITAAEQPDGTVQVDLRLDLSGRFDDQRFAGCFDYVRRWAQHEGEWRVVDARCTGAAPTDQ